jgi:hypothetical protein
MSSNLNSNISLSPLKKALQEVTPVRSEQPGINTDAVIGPSKDPKARVRYSGAARRQYEKQMQKERATQAPPETSTSTPKDKGGNVPTNAVKRARPEHCTLSPSDNHSGKRPKIADQGSYAQATKGLIRLVITLEGYPEKKLATKETSLIKKLIRGRILSQVGTTAPTFTGSWERDGALIFACANKATRDWLSQITAETKIGENTLHVMPVDELPERHRVIIHRRGIRYHHRGDSDTPRATK